VVGKVTETVLGPACAFKQKPTVWR
jgi:hypothetical protein